MTRREALNLLGAGALVTLAGPAAGAIVDAPAGGQPAALPSRLSAFSLHDVRLLESPFLDAQKRNLAYLWPRCGSGSAKTRSHPRRSDRRVSAAQGMWKRYNLYWKVAPA